MKKVLLIVGEELSANGICANAVMKELKSNGYEVVCVTNQEYNTPKSEIRNGIKIKRIKPRLTYRITAWCNKHNGSFSIFLSKLSFILNKIKLFLSIPSWPLISPLYSYRFYREAKNLYRTDKFDCIISVYSQIDTVIAGYLLKRKFPNIKFVPYFLDSLSGGYGPKAFDRNWTIKRGLKWEQILLKIADKIIVMKSSENHHNKYSKSRSYFSRMEFLDIPLLIENNSKEISTNIIEKEKINIVFVGSIPCHIRNPKYFLEIFRRITTENCKLTIIGTNTCPDVLKKAQIESTNNSIEVLNPVSHDEAISVLKNADLLLNIGNNLSSMVPSKIFEYMSIGKPIISTYPIEDEPSLEYLKKYPLSLLVKEDWERLNENVTRVENFIESYLGKQVNIADLKEEMHKNTPQAFVQEIKKIL
jgi:glycosyltransferase involved in cell wall biosynthesis